MPALALLHASSWAWEVSHPDPATLSWSQSGPDTPRAEGGAETGDRDGVKCEDSRASNEGYPKVTEDFTIAEKAPTSD